MGFLDTQIILQVRAGSNRLPGKAFLYYKGYPLFIALAKKIQTRFAQVLVATSTQKNDDLTASFCEQFDIPYYRGDEANVFKRYVDALKRFPCDHFIRLTGDNPLVDLNDLAYGLDFFKQKKSKVASSRMWNKKNEMIRTLPKGKSIDIFDTTHFMNSYKNVVSKEDQEHILPFFKEEIALIDYKSAELNRNYSVDTLEDYQNLIQNNCN